MLRVVIARLWLLVPLLLAGGLPSQVARVDPYGAGCGPVLSWIGLPALGQSMTFVDSGPNYYIQVHGYTWSDRPVFLLGVSDRFLGTTPLPVLLPVSLTNGQTGCWLLQSNDVVQWMDFGPLPPSRHVDRISLSIPNDVALLGGVFFAQWLHWHRDQQNYNDPWRQWVTLSGGARATIGR